MFGYSYHYAMHSDKQIIKLRPTLGTYAKASLPGLVAWGGLWLMLAASSKNTTSTPMPDTDETPNED